MLNKLFEGLYHKIFINIVVGISTSTVYVEEYEKKNLINSYSQSFNTTILDTQMYEYIESFVAESPYSYISILDNSTIQGAIPTCNKKKMANYCDIESSKYICYENRWAYYSSKPELNSLQNIYSKIGVDFIFSPFVVLSHFFKDKISTTLGLHVLIEQQRISLAVFDNGNLLYADYIKMDNTNATESVLLYEDEEEIDLELDNSIDLDEIESIDTLDDFGDIEDLDSLDEIEEFSELQEEEEEIQEVEEEHSALGDIDGFNEDYNSFTRIQYSINSYYQNSKYESKFIEKIYIADGVGVSRDLKLYFEEEMFLSVFARRIDILAELSELARADIK